MQRIVSWGKGSSGWNGDEGYSQGLFDLAQEILDSGHTGRMVMFFEKLAKIDGVLAYKIILRCRYCGDTEGFYRWTYGQACLESCFMLDARYALL